MSAAKAPGTPLVDRLRVPDDARGLLDALVGDVRIVEDVSEAVAAHATMPAFTYVTTSGVTVLPDGRTVIGTNPSAEAGSLERKLGDCYASGMDMARIDANGLTVGNGQLYSIFVE